MPEISIIASVLGADFAQLGKECKELEDGGIDAIQWDVMDGQFVPNLTMGPDVIAAIRPHIKTFFEAHLMVLTPEKMAKNYADAGCERIIVHTEACPNISEVLKIIADLGVQAGAAISPQTPASALEDILDQIDMALVMTVNPGWGGQKFIDAMVPKIAEVRQMLDSTGEQKDLEVDGGIGKDTIAEVVSAGANLLITGSSLFNHPSGKAQAIAEFKDLALAAD